MIIGTLWNKDIIKFEFEFLEENGDKVGLVDIVNGNVECFDDLSEYLMLESIVVDCATDDLLEGHSFGMNIIGDQYWEGAGK